MVRRAIFILLEIYNDKKVGQYVGFKGGTAALLFYGLPRFSVDLDFDLLDPSKAQQVFDHIHAILERYGTIKQTHQGKYGMSFILSYDKKVDGGYNVKVEINKKDFGSQFEKKNFLGTAMKVMVQSDMAAHKMVAMINRIGRSNRDVFDVWYFLANKWPVNSAIITQRTGLSYNKFLSKCIDALENDMVQRSILSGLGELLTAKQKAWVKSNLIKETIFQLRRALHFEEGLRPSH